MILDFEVGSGCESDARCGLGFSYVRHGILLTFIAQQIENRFMASLNGSKEPENRGFVLPGMLE
jgi:hypothetical protein